jgi:competence protein ComFC
MLYQLKYRYDRSKAEPLAEIASNFLKKQKFINQLKAIIPVPPSDLSRPFQPVTLIAQKIGKHLNLPVITDYLIKVKETSSLKNIDDSTTRKEELKDAFKVKDKRRYAGKSLLVFDDIYRSGETLTEITRVLYEEGKVKEVYVLVLTKTRTKR